jgi:hypothetical protein
MGGQWVSAALAARSYTTSDTFDFVFLCRDDAGSGSSSLYLVINVFSADGATLIGTLYDGNINTVVWTNTNTTRHADGVAVQNNVNLPENGHIVAEVGFHDPYAATFSNKIYPQDLASTAYPLNDTDTSQSKHPWLAFTYGAPPVTGYTNIDTIVFES